MRIVMMGTGGFAAPTLQALYGSPHHVVGLVTQPSREVAGRKAPPPSPMRQLATAHGTPVFDPASVNTDEARRQLCEWSPDLLVVADYGQILSPETLAAARLGGVNLHGSLLPKYRGAAPINWALYHGETETGVTTIHMTPQLDAGPCLAQARTPIDPNEDAIRLEARLAQLGAPLVLDTIAALETGVAVPLEQDNGLASRARRLRKTDGLIDWRRSAQAIHDQIRALQPWPGGYTFWQRPTGDALRLILSPGTAVLGSVEAPDVASVAPGQVLRAQGDELVVAAGTGALRLAGAQPAGKRMLSVEEFLRGYPVRPGQFFCDETTAK